MRRSIWLRARIGRGRLVILSLVVALVVPLFFLDWFRIQRQIPLWFYWKTELVLLIGIEAAYGAALLGAGSALPVLAFRCLAGRRRGQPRPRAAQLLLCAASLLLGLLAAEAVVFVWQSRGFDMPVLPLASESEDIRKSAMGRLPPPLAKVVLRQQFPDGADDKRIDLVVLGESSAEGVPFQSWLSLGALVKWQLEEAIPGLDVRLKILARSGDTLEKQHEALARLRRRPEIVIVYCGHNEFLSRFFAFSDLPYYSLDQRPGEWDRLVDRAERLSPLCGLIRRSADRCRIALPPPPIQRDLIDVPVFTLEEYSRILPDFRRRLEEIVSYTIDQGAVPILISPPGNDADFEPNRSFLPAGTPVRARESFRRAFLDARRLEDGDAVTSMKKYRDLLAREPGFAETHYRLATLLRKARQWDEAYRHFRVARDLDGYPMRCLTAFQEVYREVASRHDCIFIDGQSYFHTIGRNGLLDDELFQDAMHPSLRGQIALAQAVLYALQARRALGWPADSPPRVIDPSACRAHFGLGPETWEHAARWSSGFYSLVGRLRYDRSERSRRIDAAALAADQIEAGSDPEAVGLPNVGSPAAVPLVSGEGRRTTAKEPTPPEPWSSQRSHRP
jgi:tetratricopeptide (TPR) repeat protein